MNLFIDNDKTPLHYDYYETTIYKNQYQFTFDNGGFLKIPYVNNKSVTHPNLTFSGTNSSKILQSKMIYVFSIENCKTFEDLFIVDESTGNTNTDNMKLHSIVTQDDAFAKEFEYHIFARKENIVGVLVIEHTAITNGGGEPFYLFFLLRKSAYNSTPETSFYDNIKNSMYEQIEKSVKTHLSVEYNDEEIENFLDNHDFKGNGIDNIIHQQYESSFNISLNHEIDRSNTIPIKDYVINKNKTAILIKNPVLKVYMDIPARSLENERELENPKKESLTSIQEGFKMKCSDKSSIIKSPSNTVETYFSIFFFVVSTVLFLMWIPFALQVKEIIKGMKQEGLNKTENIKVLNNILLLILFSLFSIIFVGKVLYENNNNHQMYITKIIRVFYYLYITLYCLAFLIFLILTIYSINSNTDVQKYLSFATLFSRFIKKIPASIVIMLIVSSIVFSILFINSNNKSGSTILFCVTSSIIFFYLYIVNITAVETSPLLPKEGGE